MYNPNSGIAFENNEVVDCIRNCDFHIQLESWNWIRKQ